MVRAIDRHSPERYLIVGIIAALNMYSGITVGIGLHTWQKTHEADRIIVSHELGKLAHPLHVHDQSSFSRFPYGRSVPAAYEQRTVQTQVQRISLRSHAKAKALKHQERKQ